MTTTTPASAPAILGGDPAFPQGLPLTQVRVRDRSLVLGRIEAALESGRLTNGHVVRELEDAVAERLDVKHVVAVANCTTGLMLVLQALGVAGKRVVAPSFTFAATAHAIAWAGGEPAFADCDSDSLTLDPADAGNAAPGSAAIMATHVYGTPCAVEDLEKLAGDAALPLVFDAAHALGSSRRGRAIGGFGTAEVFSLSPTKVAVAGEGGLVSTNDADLAYAIRIGRDYGNPGDYDCRFPGLNARMSELHAAVALASLGELDENVRRRNELAAAFHAGIAGIPGLRVPVVDNADVSTYKDLTIIVDPDEYGLDVPTLVAALAAEGVDTRRYYYPPVHRQRAYDGIGPRRALPVTDLVAPRVLTLPLWAHMPTETIKRLADLLVLVHENARLIAAARP